jgi:hypothetical protein
MGLNNFSQINMKTENIIGNIQAPPLMEYVIAEEGIEKYIESPCIKACQQLWKLNISTLESSGNNNGGWIAISFNSLSEENKRILNDYINRDIEGYSDEISGKNYWNHRKPSKKWKHRISS